MRKGKSKLHLILLLFAILLAVLPGTASADCTPCPNFTIYTKHDGVSCEEPRIVLDLYKNVPAFSNNGDDGGSYQCVEYIRRFYDLRKGYSQGVVCSAAWRGHAIEYADRAKAEDDMGLRYFENGGTEPPMPGDIVVFGIGNYGHVVIIKRVIKNETQKLQGIVTVEQNYGSSGRILDAREDNGKFYIDEGNARCWLRSKFTCPEETSVYNAERDIPIIALGEPNDIPITGDWNGDGSDTIGVYRPTTSTFYLDHDNDGDVDEDPIQLGVFGDIPIIGDWDNDGKDEIGIYRSGDPDKNFAGTSVFFLDYNNDGAIDENDDKIEFGIWRDLPITGDWDNDGYDEIGVFRAGDRGIDISTFFLDDNNDGIADKEIEYGMLEDIPISGDWNGEGKDTIGVYRECNAIFYLNNLDGKASLKIRYGFDYEIPITGDWNGDGIDSIGVFRPSDPETGGFTTFLLTNDIGVHPAIIRGLQYLRTTQNPDGSWSNNVGVTSLAVLSFLNAGYNENDPDVRDAIGYICSKVQGDGRITTGSDTYETSLAILALVATHNNDYSTKIENATSWVKDSQWDKDCRWENVDKDNWYYGGFGYGSHSRPDMSNTQFALMALDAVQSISKDDILWDKAQVFLARTQNRQEDVYIPDLDYTVEWNPTYNKYDDGGFVYYPGASLAGDVNSYGSMTGAGIWGLRLSDVEKGDPRVEAALDWLIDNYMMDGNPGMSNPGTFQYYYYLSMSKALTMTEPDLIDGHNWYQDLSDNLTALQKPEGYWVNDRDTWCWENNKDLVTSYAILSLQTLAEIPEDIQRLSYITVILHSNADLHAYDPLGRHVGKNYDTGGIDLEVPNATYTSNGAQNITIPGLETGNYRIVLVGTGTGEYTLNVTGGVGNETVSEDSYTATISEGEVHDSTVNVAMITWLTIHVDAPDPIDPIVLAATGTGNVSFIADAGTIVNLTALNETDLPAENPTVDFPHGLFSFNITGLDQNQTVNITIAFPQYIPTTAQYWKYHTPEGWYLIPMGSNDGDNIITITLQDGGMGDDDEDANGVIVDQGGPGIPVAAPNITSFAPLSPVNDTVCNGRTFNITVNQTYGVKIRLDF